MTKLAPSLTATAIMPMYNAGAYLEKTLPPLLGLLDDALIEVLVIDDASTDDSRKIAERLGARVIESSQRQGPGAARNLGARVAQGELLVLVDADVAIHAPAVNKLREVFSSSDVVAAFGSYDDKPSHQGFWSQYKNLLHHFTHQHGPSEASTFWAGIGAVRKDAFLRCGGFDTERYSEPSIEDIELGYRLRGAGGRVRLLPDAQGTHFKHWTLRGLIGTDVFRRALPWSRLLLSSSQAASDLNVNIAERGKACIAILFLASLPLAIIGLLPAWAPVAILIAAAATNAPLVRLFHRRRGFVFAFGGLLFHQVYYLYSTAVFAWCWLAHLLGQSRNS